SQVEFVPQRRRYLRRRGRGVNAEGREIVAPPLPSSRGDQDGRHLRSGMEVLAQTFVRRSVFDERELMMRQELSKFRPSKVAVEKHVRLGVGGDLRRIGEAELESHPSLAGEWDGLVAIDSGRNAFYILTPGEPLQEREDGRQGLL